MHSSSISDLRRKRDYYLQDAPDWVRTFWTKPESFNWFIKNNRSELTHQGAILRLGRDYFIDLNQFPHAAKNILGLSPQKEISEETEVAE